MKTLNNIQKLAGKVGITTLAMLIFYNANCQESNVNGYKNHQLGISIGSLHYQLKDEIIAPLRWDGFGVIAKLNYSIISEKGIHDIKLSAPFAFPTSRYNQRAMAFEIDAGYKYLYKIREQFLIGGFFSWNQNMQEYKDWDGFHMYWLNIYDIGFTAKWSQIYNEKHLLGTDIELPLVAMIGRPSKCRYNSSKILPDEIFYEPNKNMKLASFNNYLVINIGINYLYKISQKIALGLNYQLVYKTYAEPEQISIISNSLSAKLQLNINKTK